LSLHEERLQDLAAKRSELQRRVEEKRHELMRERQLALAGATRQHEDARKQLEEMDTAYGTYLAEDPVLPAFSEERPQADIAPLPISEESLLLKPQAAPPSKIFWMSAQDQNKETHQ
jgi:hypothetical protein